MSNIAHQKAIEYVTSVSTIKAKKIIFALNNMGSNELLSRSNIPEIRHISTMYEVEILGEYAVKLASRLVKACNAKYNTFLTMYQINDYKVKNIHCKNIIDAVGIYGFDYILSVLQNTKTNIMNNNSNVNEELMLKSLKWSETREHTDISNSNKYHRQKGLEFAGFEEMAEYLIPYSEIIAELYKDMQLEGNEIIIATYPIANLECDQKTNQTVRSMKVHFLQSYELINRIYEVKELKCPEGYEEEDLTPNSLIIRLAKKGFLTHSKEILEYVDNQRLMNEVYKAAQAEFSNNEMDAILKNKEAILQLIADEW